MRLGLHKKTIVFGLIGLVCLGLVGLFFFLQTQAKAKHAAFVAEARSAINDRRADDARRIIDAWSSWDPSDPDPDFHRAWLELTLEKPVQSVDAMRKAVAKGLPEERLAGVKAVIQARGGQFEMAEPVLRRVYAAGEEPRPEILECLTRIFMRTYRMKEAAKAAEDWAKLATKDPRPFLWKAEIDERSEVEAPPLIQYYTFALDRDPSLDDTRAKLAAELFKATRVDDAAREYEKVIAHDPQNPAAHVGLGKISLQKGDSAAASTHFEAALAARPDDVEALREASSLDLRSGKADRAIERLKKAAAIAPFDSEVRYAYAQALNIKGDAQGSARERKEADRLRAERDRMTELRQALAQRPDDAELRFQAAKWLIENGHEAEGLEWTELLLKSNPGHLPTCRYLADYHATKGNTGLANYYRLQASRTTEKANP